MDSAPIFRHFARTGVRPGRGLPRLPWKLWLPAKPAEIKFCANRDCRWVSDNPTRGRTKRWSIEPVATATAPRPVRVGLLDAE